MKIYLIILVVYISFIQINAQNLIPNPSFEKFDTSFVLPGPYYLNQSFGIYDDWESINTADFYYTENYWIFDNMAPSLFDSLVTYVYVGADSCFLCVPQNNFGYRTARTGNGYTGIRAYSGAYGHNYKEFIKVEFTEPLIQDKLYHISFYVCPSTQNPFFLNSLGAYVSDFELNSYPSSSVSAQILTNQTLSNTSEWVEVKGLYRANGGESHITIGNFDTDTVFDDPFFDVPLSCLYYFLEDVSVYPYSNLQDTSICQGDTIVIKPLRQENASCLWQNGSTDSIFYAYEEGTYWMKQSYYIAETSTMAYHYDTIIVSYKQVDSLLTTNLGNDTSICTGETITLNTTNSDANYLWSNGSNGNQFTTGQSGLIWLKEFNECLSTSDTINLNVIAPLTLDLGSDTSFCIGDTIVIIPTINTNEIHYLWHNGSESETFIASEEGMYWLQVKNQCEVIADTIQINHFDSIFVDLGQDTTICFNTSHTLRVICPNVNILWGDGSTGNSLDVNEAGLYHVSISNQCKILRDSIEISVYPRLQLNLGEDIKLCEDDTIGFEVHFDVSNENAKYLWQDGSNKANYTINKVGNYWVEVSSSCEKLKDDLIVKYFCRCELFFPNCFTPNQDEINDRFLSAQNCDYLNYHLQIFDRWGERIYETFDNKIGWDGTYKGQICPIGVYSYKVNYQFLESYVIGRKTGKFILAK